MDTVLTKLSIENTDLAYHYLINDVSIALKLALNNKKIKNNIEVRRKLSQLYKRVLQIPIPYNEIILENQLEAYHIGLDAKEILEEII